MIVQLRKHMQEFEDKISLWLKEIEIQKTQNMPIASLDKILSYITLC